MPDRASGIANRQRRLRRTVSRLRIIVRSVPLLLKVDRGPRKCLDVGPEAIEWQVGSQSPGRGLFRDIAADIPQSPMVELR